MPFLVTDRWGYAPVGAYGQPELYDLTADPTAANDIAADHSGVVNDLHNLFMAHLSDHQAPEAFAALWTRTGDSETGGGGWAIDYPE